MTDDFQDGRNRILFNFKKCILSSQEYESSLSLLTSIEQERIGRFKRPQKNGEYLRGKDNPDAMSSLIGRLLLLYVVKKEMRLDIDQIVLERTKENKPFLVNNVREDVFPCFNFNVSHAGDYVAIVSDPFYIVGVDVMKIEITGSDKNVNNFFNIMRDCFTPYEWDVIKGKDGDFEKLKFFFCLLDFKGIIYQSNRNRPRVPVTKCRVYIK